MEVEVKMFTATRYRSTDYYLWFDDTTIVFPHNYEIHILSAMIHTAQSVKFHELSVEK